MTTETNQIARRYLNRKQGAAYVGLSLSAFDRIATAGRVRRLKLLPHRRMFDIRDLDAFMASCGDAAVAAE